MSIPNNRRGVRTISVDPPVRTRFNHRSASRAVSVDVVSVEPINSISSVHALSADAIHVGPIRIQLESRITRGQPYVRLNRIREENNINRNNVSADDTQSQPIIDVQSQNSVEVQNSDQPNSILSVNEQIIAFNVRQPAVLLDRLDINSNVNRDIASNNGSQDSAIVAPDRVIYSDYSFVHLTREKSQLLYVKDISHLYRLRYTSKTGIRTYQCRERKKKCEAKVFIDTDGVCVESGNAPHLHASDPRRYHNHLVASRVRDDVLNDDILEQPNLRVIWEKRTIE